MGAAMQSSAAVSSATVILGFDKAVFGIAFAVLSAVFIVGRREKIKSITAALIPVAALAYILISCAVIVRYRAELARVVSEIFCLAFTPSAAGGGIAGSLISSPIVRGYSTGILSNEAGAGTSSMAHASDMGATPVAAGLSGMLEVVADTMLLCMLTAFAILLPSPELSDVGGAELVVSSMSGAFLGADWLLFLSVFSFALATVACWYYYGTVCMRYLFGGAGVKFFLPIYLLFVLLGAFYDCAVFAALSDVLLLFLTVLVAPVLIKSSGRIKRLSEQYGIIKGEFSTRVPHKVS